MTVRGMGRGGGIGNEEGEGVGWEEDGSCGKTFLDCVDRRGFADEREMRKLYIWVLASTHPI